MSEGIPDEGANKQLEVDAKVSRPATSAPGNTRGGAQDLRGIPLIAWLHKSKRHLGNFLPPERGLSEHCDLVRGRAVREGGATAGRFRSVTSSQAPLLNDRKRRYTSSAAQ